MLNPSNKRTREDDVEEASGPHEPVIPHKKKPRPLPLRKSPVLKHIKPLPRNRSEPSFPTSSTLTPAESSDDDPMQEGDRDMSQNQQMDIHSHAFNSMRVPYESDSDFEMVDSQPRSATMQPLWSAGSGPSRPESSLESPIPSFLLNQSLTVSGGRTATPIFSHFTSNMTTDSMMRDPVSLAEQQLSRTSQRMPADEAGWWRRRRLPSPISEDEAQADAMGFTESSERCPDEIVNFPGSYNPSGIRISITPAQANVLPAGPPQVPNLQTTQDTSAENWQNMDLPPGNSPTTHDSSNASSSRPVSQLNGHLTGSERPKKLTIAMGYRADCDKCRQRVPGHYSHIIRS
ncbi:predicted protein [Uncinocarpus reesii 1704]|uniref:Uncharacterized protein n=1 Tax=Uncinocarpus reesii (strain UAMH 1704) TaxID=336963 RepID=C4JJ22_UNCRE|nr:uncharacterized protein UREG_01629 [Uncinocarpus reesii 1704]EEP76780.1 predicted protein [Uncinocarpus reesii 1704]